MSGERPLTNRARESIDKRVRSETFDFCREALETFVDCSKDRTFSVVWECRADYSKLQECIAAVDKDTIRDRLVKEHVANLDASREEYLQREKRSSFLEGERRKR